MNRDYPKTKAEAARETYPGIGMGPGARYVPGKCVAAVRDRGMIFPTYHQCERKPGFGPAGLYCKIHDPEKVKAREDERTRRFNFRCALESGKWEAIALLRDSRRGIGKAWMKRRDELLAKIGQK